MENNYIDLNYSGEQVKKGIEEITEVFINNTEEDNEKIFTIEKTSTNDIEEYKIKLKTKEDLGIDVPGIYGQFITANGSGWIDNINLYKHTDNQESGILYLSTIARNFGIFNNDNTDNTFVFNIKDDAKTIFADHCKINGSGNAIVDFSNNCKINGNGNAIVNFTDNSKMTVCRISETMIKDASKITAQGKNEVYINNGANICIESSKDKSPLWDNTRVKISDSSLDIIGNDQHTEVTIKDGAQLYMDNETQSNGTKRYTGPNAIGGSQVAPFIYMHDKAGVLMDKGSILHMSDTAKIDMNGTGRIVFNGNEANHNYGPTLVMDPKGIVFTSESDSLYDFPSFDNFYGTNIQIRDNNYIVMDGKGKTNITIHPDGTNTILFNNNMFLQMTGNAHSEMHDNSCLIMRGPKNNSKVDGSSDNYSENTHLNKEWVTTIKADGSPVIGMYDISQFTMRGRWNPITTDRVYLTNAELENIWTDFDKNAVDTYTIANLPETVKNYILSKKDYLKDIEDLYDESNSNLLKTKFTYSNYSNTLSITNIKATLDLEIKKISGQPVLEIIDDSEVRINGNSVFKLNDFIIEANHDGINFSNGNDTVTFSITELQKLKELIQNN